jgi:DNA-binding NarL/FixJ family response regulator
MRPTVAVLSTNDRTSIAAAQQLEAESLERIVLACLESLADLARTSGDSPRAIRLQEAASLLRGQPPATGAARLTDREWEVAVLVARGLSNRQIAAQLVVSERTVDTHVSHILRKLSLVSRAQIAAWAVQHRKQFRLLP